MYHVRLHVYSDPGVHDYFMYNLKLMFVLSAVEINQNSPVLFPWWRNNPSRSLPVQHADHCGQLPLQTHQMSDFPNVSDVARYSKVKRVGKGSFGEVWLVKDMLSPKQNSLIMKEVHLRGLPASEKQATMNEVRVLQHLQHSNIIAYQNSFVDGEKLHIIMEHAAGGDLASAIAVRRKQRGARFSEAEILTIVRELVDALSYCHHECKLLHRDLKPANIFLSSSGHVKLGDFGISKVMDMSCQLAHTQCGTPLYMSPEMCRGHAYSRAADTWAVGCVLFELMTLTPPWEKQAGGRGAGLGGLLRQISTSQLQIDVPALRSHYSRELCELLVALLAKNPNERPDLATVRDGPLLQNARRNAKPTSPPRARLSPPPHGQHAVACGSPKAPPRVHPLPRGGVHGGVLSASAALTAAEAAMPPLPPPPATPPPQTPPPPSAPARVALPNIGQGRRIHAQRKPALPLAARNAPEPAAIKAAIKVAAANLILRSFRAHKGGGVLDGAIAAGGGAAAAACPVPVLAPMRDAALQARRDAKDAVAAGWLRDAAAVARRDAAAACAIQITFRKSLMRRRAAVAMANFRGAPPRPSHVAAKPLQAPLSAQPLGPLALRRQTDDAAVVAESSEVQRAKDALIFAPKPSLVPNKVIIQVGALGGGVRGGGLRPVGGRDGVFGAFVHRRPLPIVGVRCR
jgi:serine/threonine protein kinase